MRIMTYYIILPVSPQGSSQRRQSATQAPGPAGHGAATQAVALQAPRQPLPHQDGENPAGPRLTNDPGPGESAPVDPVKLPASLLVKRRC